MNHDLHPREATMHSFHEEFIYIYIRMYSYMVVRFCELSRSFSKQNSWGQWVGLYVCGERNHVEGHSCRVCREMPAHKGEKAPFHYTPVLSFSDGSNCPLWIFQMDEEMGQFGEGGTQKGYTVLRNGRTGIKVDTGTFWNYKHRDIAYSHIRTLSANSFIHQSCTWEHSRTPLPGIYPEYFKSSLPSLPLQLSLRVPTIIILTCTHTNRLRITI